MERTLAPKLTVGCHYIQAKWSSPIRTLKYDFFRFISEKVRSQYADSFFPKSLNWSILNTYKSKKLSHYTEFNFSFSLLLPV
jgi:hypothetical protein